LTPAKSIKQALSPYSTGASGYYFNSECRAGAGRDGCAQAAALAALRIKRVGLRLDCVIVLSFLRVTPKSQRAKGHFIFR
jgi:hypothetical protein